jgi:hypothetical protein
MSSIFHWIRQVAQSDLSHGCKAFCLELVPLVDTQSLTCTRSVAWVAGRTTFALSSVKTYRRRLKSRGLLAPGALWLLTPKAPQSTAQPTSAHTNTAQPTSAHTNTEKVFPQILNKPPYPLEERSTSVSDRKKNTRAPLLSVSLDTIPPRYRPDTHNRKPQHPLDLAQWAQTWLALRGTPWGWVMWARAVLPYLSDTERIELAQCGSAVESPNLGLMRSIASRLCKGSSTPRARTSSRAGRECVPVVTPGRSADDDAFLSALS